MTTVFIYLLKEYSDSKHLLVESQIMVYDVVCCFLLKMIDEENLSC